MDCTASQARTEANISTNKKPLARGSAVGFDSPPPAKKQVTRPGNSKMMVCANLFDKNFTTIEQDSAIATSEPLYDERLIVDTSPRRKPPALKTPVKKQREAKKSSETKEIKVARKIDKQVSIEKAVLTIDADDMQVEEFNETYNFINLDKVAEANEIELLCSVHNFALRFVKACEVCGDTPDGNKEFFVALLRKHFSDEFSSRDLSLTSGGGKSPTLKRIHRIWHRVTKLPEAPKKTRLDAKGVISRIAGGNLIFDSVCDELAVELGVSPAHIMNHLFFECIDPRDDVEYDPREMHSGVEFFTQARDSSNHSAGMINEGPHQLWSPKPSPDVVIRKSRNKKVSNENLRGLVGETDTDTDELLKEKMIDSFEFDDVKKAPLPTSDVIVEAFQSWCSVSAADVSESVKRDGTPLIVYEHPQNIDRVAHSFLASSSSSSSSPRSGRYSL